MGRTLGDIRYLRFAFDLAGKQDSGEAQVIEQVWVAERVVEMGKIQEARELFISAGIDAMREFGKTGQRAQRTFES